MYYSKKNRKKEEGLILLEMIVAIGIFLSVMTIAMGALLTMYGVSKKSQSLKTVMDNLNFAVESMAREIVVGTDYHCDVDSGLIEDPQNCGAEIGEEGGTSITFCSSNDEQIFYRFDPNSGSIQRYIEEGVETCGSGNPSGNDWVSVTAEEVTITGMNFYVTGATDPEPEAQPLVLLTIEGEAGSGKESEKSEFNLQVSLSQRSPKIVVN